MNVENTGLHVEYTGRGITISPKCKQLADTELARIDQVIGRSVSAHVIFTEDKYRKIVEVTLKTPTEMLVATCEDTDMLVALQGALNKVEQQAIKHKQRKITVERHGKPDSAEPLIELATPEASL